MRVAWVAVLFGFRHRYDSNGNGMDDGSDDVWPRCDTLDIVSGPAGAYDAAHFGCVSTTTATAHGHPPSTGDAAPLHEVTR